MISTARTRVNTADNATADCGDELHIAQRAEARRDSYLTQHAPRLAQLEHHEHAIRIGLDQIVDRRRNASPGYLTNKLGTPDNTNEYDWRQLVSQIEDYRIRHNITDPMTPLGAIPTDPKYRKEYAALDLRIQKYVHLHNAQWHTIMPPTKQIEPPTIAAFEQPQQRRGGPELGM